MNNKKKKKIELHELEGVFLSLQFLNQEPEECLTEYGKGLLNGLIDESVSRKCPVVIKKDYENLEKELENIKKKWWYKLFSKYL